MVKKIYIGKLPNTVTDQQLRKIFLEIGDVVSVDIVQTTNFEKNTNYGYVRMDSEEHTLQAIKTLDNSVLEGSRIKVVEAHFLDQDKQERRYWNKRKY